jgi:hypothetical protein
MRLALACCLLLLPAGCRGPAPEGLRAVNHAYRSAWLAGDSALDITTEGAAVAGSTGTLWGRFTLAFAYEAAGTTRRVRNAGT